MPSSCTEGHLATSAGTRSARSASRCDWLAEALLALLVMALVTR